MWRDDGPDSGWGHSLAFRQENVATAASDFAEKMVTSFFLLLFFGFLRYDECGCVFLSNV